MSWPLSFRRVRHAWSSCVPSRFAPSAAPYFNPALLPHLPPLSTLPPLLSWPSYISRFAAMRSFRPLVRRLKSVLLKTWWLGSFHVRWYVLKSVDLCRCFTIERPTSQESPCTETYVTCWFDPELGGEEIVELAQQKVFMHMMPAIVRSQVPCDPPNLFQHLSWVVKGPYTDTV